MRGSPVGQTIAEDHGDFHARTQPQRPGLGEQTPRRNHFLTGASQRRVLSDNEWNGGPTSSPVCSRVEAQRFKVAADTPNSTETSSAVDSSGNSVTESKPSRTLRITTVTHLPFTTYTQRLTRNLS
jgi:hypothetical protein